MLHPLKGTGSCPQTQTQMAAGSYGNHAEVRVTDAEDAAGCGGRGQRGVVKGGGAFLSAPGVLQLPC